ncbi:MAG TPA: 30S ribosomal protein S12 methylthiotransferase RimO [Mesotoga sp.]|nr:30S ribosomal protein S12 methylthiotransferase RimO [Mesotoga sp.]NLX33221.1 30S ribosomal protein S12 methylthiotransferase RimO [Thermotogaceae bacterium]MDD4040024.1 30S ribosomal protein S12 methylthiotransferase RimO [Mesotoga sp.]MDD4478446.1 30S ribosomal protein S12 methylthiotransferase RimO [Mesotoga sp.]MDD5743155.1 30S ribosomal protein S12 methylthiotransferase RimO [Mesotoga sp.]
MNLGVLTLGCPKNLADMDNFAGIMKSQGHTIVDEIDMADLIVIDTCGFIEEAKKESIDEIFKAISARKGKPGLKIIAVGCLVQRYFDEMKSDIPELDGLIGVTSPLTLARLIERGELFYFQEPEGVYGYFNRRATGYSAYVKIGDGCNRNCAFCSIPLFKGLSVSRSLESLKSEALSLVRKGVKEIVLVSQDNTQYGRDLDGDLDLGRLLRELNDLNEEFWIRVMYLHPDHVDLPLIDTMLELPKVVDYFDMPVQSGSDRILKAMGRTRNSSELGSIFNFIRDKAPHSVLRTTIMLGFPGETEETFRETMNFVKSVEFDRLGGFVYSSEEGTDSFNKRRTTTTVRAKEMLELLLQEQDGISAARLSQYRGKVLKVLVEEAGQSYSIGRAFNSAPEIDGVVVLKGHVEEGLFTNVRITDTFEHDMEGVVLDELA